MNKFESLDIETIWDEYGIAKPICIAITSGDKILFKRVDINEIDNGYILDFLLDKCSSKKIYYVHNLTFEIFVFLNDIIKKKLKFKVISSNKTVYSAEVYYNKKKIRLRCSYRLTMMSLKKLADISGIEKKDIFPYKLLNKDIKEFITVKIDDFNSEEEFIEFVEKNGKNINVFNILEDYCKNDALITKNSIIKYWKIIEENGLKMNNNILTAARLSIENYFMNNKMIKKKISIKDDRMIRDWYFGGRSEVFGNPRSDEILLHYDWSGMYAQCMCEKILGGEIVKSNIIKDFKHPGFYWIKFEQNMYIPVLPVKREKLIFANGIFEGWYWFEEILLAIEMGVKILSVEKIISCQYYDYFMKDFVEINNKIRDISPLHKAIGKNNNNTFYGRLGMNPDRLDEIIIDKIDDNHNYEKVIEKNGIFLAYKKSEKSVSNILVSASITSKARIKLYRGMVNVMKIGGRIMYTDTDSIIAAFKKDSYLKALDNNIGEVFFDSKKNDTIILDGVFAMPKTYSLKYLNGEEITKIKGFNNTPDFDKFKDKFYKKEYIETENNEWNKKDLIIKFISRTKRTNLNSLDKRIWSEDMKDTFPLNL